MEVRAVLPYDRSSVPYAFQYASSSPSDAGEPPPTTRTGVDITWVEDGDTAWGLVFALSGKGIVLRSWNFHDSEEKSHWKTSRMPLLIPEQERATCP